MGVGAIAGAGLSVIGNGLTAYANFRAGQENQAINEWNAKIQDTRARDAVRIGQNEESTYRRNVRKIIGDQRAGYAGQNVVVSSGSAATVAETTAQIGEQDALTIRNNAAREAWGFKVAAHDYRLRGDAAMAQGRMAAYASLLNGGAGAIGALA